MVGAPPLKPTIFLGIVVQYTPLHASYSQRESGVYSLPLYTQRGYRHLPRVQGLHYGVLPSLGLERVLPWAIRLNEKKDTFGHCPFQPPFLAHGMAHRYGCLGHHPRTPTILLGIVHFKHPRPRYRKNASFLAYGVQRHGCLGHYRGYLV